MINVESGNYSNASEYVRDLIRKEQERTIAIAEIQKLIDEGEASGYVPFDPDEFRKELARRVTTLPVIPADAGIQTFHDPAC